MVPNQVKKDFQLVGDSIPLSGGQGTSFLIKDAVVKPVDNVKHSERVLSIVDQLFPTDYRIAKPVKTRRNTFVSQGWQCTRYEAGKEKQGKVKEKLAISRMLHHDLRKIENSILVNMETNDPWSIAHQVAWEKMFLPSRIHQQAAKIIQELLDSTPLQEHYEFQIIHGDLAGNILFDHRLPPLVIDFSPTLAPVAYAEAILIVDCIAWQGEELAAIDLLSNNKEMINRAVIFRLTVEALLSGEDEKRFSNQYKLFHSIIQYFQQTE